MFVNKLFTYPRVHTSESKRCFNVKSSTYYFHMKTKILTGFQICISVPLKIKIIIKKKKNDNKKKSLVFVKL